MAITSGPLLDGVEKVRGLFLRELQVDFDAPVADTGPAFSLFKMLHFHRPELPVRG
tara:strand:- start:785 stop:952 length:168 start_codon:yes stop_codon:yes gene_type:complete